MGGSFARFRSHFTLTIHAEVFLRTRNHNAAPAALQAANDRGVIDDGTEGF